MEHTISRHAMERYAERIMGKEGTLDANYFITTHEDKIKTDINKLIEFGTLIYSGKQNKKDAKNPNAIINVYLKDCWVVLVNSNTKNVITLYKIDLGLDEEFNKSYIGRMLEKLREQQDIFASVQAETEEESITYRDLIEDAETQIKYYRSMIKNLENLCVGYKTIIDNNRVKIDQASKGVVDVLNTLIGKREF